MKQTVVFRNEALEAGLLYEDIDLIPPSDSSEAVYWAKSQDVFSIITSTLNDNHEEGCYIRYMNTIMKVFIRIATHKNNKWKVQAGDVSLVPTPTQWEGVTLPGLVYQIQCSKAHIIGKSLDCSSDISLKIRSEPVGKVERVCPTCYKNSRSSNKTPNVVNINNLSARKTIVIAPRIQLESNKSAN
ncbi:hypothetical protein RSOL_456990, partial [Rhizoctonia solani AG-3 Rhs1AP]